jgi:hypothetical protein
MRRDRRKSNRAEKVIEQKTNSGSSSSFRFQVLLEVYLKFADVVKKAFNNDPAFVASLDKVIICTEKAKKKRN